MAVVLVLTGVAVTGVAVIANSISNSSLNEVTAHYPTLPHTPRNPLSVVSVVRGAGCLGCWVVAWKGGVAGYVFLLQRVTLCC